MLDRLAAILRDSEIRRARAATGIEEFLGVKGEAVNVVVLASQELGARQLDQLRLVRERLRETPAVWVGPMPDRRLVREALRVGLAGLVLEGELEDCLVPAIWSAAAGQLSLPGSLRELVAKPTLSTREKQILAMVVLGFNNGEISRKLHLAESTVKSHLSSSFAKLGVRSRNQAAALILDPSAGLGAGILAITDAEDAQNGFGNPL